MSNISEVFPGLFVGGRESSFDEILQSNVSSIVCLEQKLFDNYKGRIDYLNIKIEDSPDEDISGVFDTSFNFIKKNLNEHKNILIQCKAGVSRSGTIAIMYIMTMRKQPLLKTLCDVKKKRVIVKPNVGFFKALLRYEKNLLGSNSLSIDDYDELL